MGIRLDFTQESVVVVCDKCPEFRALRFDRVSAWTAAADHESAQHPGQKQARLASNMARSGHVKVSAAALESYTRAAKLNS
ncbi:hypothetical protein CVCC1112_2629 [Paenarthrobacter nicotinovorans]|nr:hypothetical protein CVCC1112_2629 [Paenarthrobacter nicotinovorans]